MYVQEARRFRRELLAADDASQLDRDVRWVRILYADCFGLLMCVDVCVLMVFLSVNCFDY